MFITKHTIQTKATPNQIWQLWEDADNWKKWDQQIEFSRVHGPFQTGTKGSTKFIGTPAFPTKLLNVEPKKRVVQEARLLLAKVISHQRMKQKGDHTEVTFEVEIRGPLAFFYAWKTKKFIQEKIPLEMEEMEKCALAVAE